MVVSFFFLFGGGGGGGYTRCIMVSVKIVNMVKMSWVKTGNKNRIRFILPMQKAVINILSQAKFPFSSYMIYEFL